MFSIMLKRVRHWTLFQVKRIKLEALTLQLYNLQDPIKACDLCDRPRQRASFSWLLPLRAACRYLHGL